MAVAVAQVRAAVRVVGRCGDGHIYSYDYVRFVGRIRAVGSGIRFGRRNVSVCQPDVRHIIYIAVASASQAPECRLRGLSPLSLGACLCAAVSVLVGGHACFFLEIFAEE